ncbi:unnamed protein product [Periconia digitata]|uniref:Uncharacterized protein n=1 Tax=Periconia digitata TaxID=1303443 RepID=A0A9W4UVB2_9PLEO|nr:unnamed protein product [Periconia digitata]
MQELNFSISDTCVPPSISVSHTLSSSSSTIIISISLPEQTTSISFRCPAITPYHIPLRPVVQRHPRQLSYSNSAMPEDREVEDQP